MKEYMGFISDWRFWFLLVSVCSFLFSIINLMIGRHVANKIMGNDLKHITADIVDLKKENKEIKIDLKADLGKIFKRLGRIDKGLAIRKAICDERHSKDRK